MRRNLILAAICAIGLSACSPANSPSTAPATQTGSPVIGYADAFVMEPIGGRDMTMGGVTLTVTEANTRLVAASSPAFGAIELHTMAMHDGKMRMRQVEGFDIAAGESLSLKRGGNHFMMFDVADNVTGGSTVEITLEFDTGAPETLKLVVPAEVRVVGE